MCEQRTSTKARSPNPEPKQVWMDGAKNVSMLEPKPEPEIGFGFHSPSLWGKRVVHRTVARKYSMGSLHLCMGA